MGARWQKGSVRLEGKHLKMWVGRFLEDQIVDGQVRRIQKSVRLGTQDQFATKRLAQRELDKLVRPINAAGYRPKHKMALQQASEKWLREVVAVKFKPSSRASSRSNLKRILEVFGQVECTAIRPGDLSTWVARLHNSGLIPDNDSQLHYDIPNAMGMHPRLGICGSRSVETGSGSEERRAEDSTVLHARTDPRDSVAGDRGALCYDVSYLG